MTAFKTRRLQVEARRHDSTSYLAAQELAAWCGGEAVKNESAHGSAVLVPTPDGEAEARLGDWVVRVDGGFFVVPDALFRLLFKEPDEKGATDAHRN